LNIKTKEKKKNERKKNYKLKGIQKRKIKKKSREVPLKMDAEKTGKSRGKPGEHRRKEK